MLVEERKVFLGGGVGERTGSGGGAVSVSLPLCPQRPARGQAQKALTKSLNELMECSSPESPRYLKFFFFGI